MKKVLPLNRNESYNQYYNSNYTSQDKGHWIPSGSSLWDNVNHLVPNHYFDSSLDKQIRYFPNRTLVRRKPKDAVKELSALLRKTMLAANNRYSLALAISSGLDSRLVLSSCKEIAQDIYYYTLIYDNLTSESLDIIIPDTLLKGLGLNHNIIDCRQPLNEKL